MGVSEIIPGSADVPSDNNEYSLRDDSILFANKFDDDRTVSMKGPQTVGLMGRMIGTEMMGKVWWI